jgi:hypothetical protein
MLRNGNEDDVHQAAGARRQRRELAAGGAVGRRGARTAQPP